MLYGIDVIVATRPFPETVNFACHTWYSRAVSIGSLNSKTNVQGPFISSVGLNLIHSSKPKIYDVTVKFLVRKITCGPFVLGQNKFRFQFGHFWTWILTCERWLVTHGLPDAIIFACDKWSCPCCGHTGLVPDNFICWRTCDITFWTSYTFVTSFTTRCWILCECFIRLVQNCPGVLILPRATGGAICQSGFDWLRSCSGFWWWCTNIAFDLNIWAINKFFLIALFKF